MRPSRSGLFALALVLVAVPGYAYVEGGLRHPPQLATYLAVQRRTVPRARVVSGFNDWRTVSKYRSHAGLHLGYDVALPRGSRVVAGWSGRVVRILPWYRQQVGITVRDADGFETTYGHLRSLVRTGAWVSAGGAVGITLIDHVDIKMRAPDGAYYDFGKPGPAVAYRPRRPTGRVAARTPSAEGPRVAYEPGREGPPVADEPDGPGGGYDPEQPRAEDDSGGPGRGYEPDGRRGANGPENGYEPDGPRGGYNAGGTPDASEPDWENSDSPRADDHSDPRETYDPNDPGEGPKPPVAYPPGPWGSYRPAPRPADPRDAAEALRRYLWARYNLDVTRDEAERVVAAERAARMALKRQRAALRRLGFPSPAAMGPVAAAWTRTLREEWRRRHGDLAVFHRLVRQARHRLDAARGELRRMGIPEPR